jgi:hypothetical protein
MLDLLISPLLGSLLTALKLNNELYDHRKIIVQTLTKNPPGL